MRIGVFVAVASMLAPVISSATPEAPGELIYLERPPAEGRPWPGSDGLEGGVLQKAKVLSERAPAPSPILTTELKQPAWLIYLRTSEGITDSAGIFTPA